MVEGFPFQILSNVASIVLLGILLYKYLTYKRNLDYVKFLTQKHESNSLTEDEKTYVINNEREYKFELATANNKIKLANPIFLTIIVLVVFFTSFQEALGYLNVVIVGFLFMQIDKIHKNNLHTFLNRIKVDIKKVEEKKAKKK